MMIYWKPYENIRKRKEKSWSSLVMQSNTKPKWDNLYKTWRCENKNFSHVFGSLKMNFQFVKNYQYDCKLPFQLF
jgi:hypothetical protein